MLRAGCIRRTLSDQGTVVIDPCVESVRRVALSWADAINRSDVHALRPLMADDIVVIHGNGRVLSGREAVLADLAESFEPVRVAQDIEFEETVIAGTWAFDRARVTTKIAPLESDAI